MGPICQPGAQRGKGGPKAGALSCDGGENQAGAPPTRGLAGPMEGGGGPRKSGPMWKVWAGWAKIKGEF
jgi:hypothetical protein